jgi:hypothetical protein
MKQYNLFEEDFLSKWKKVKDRKNLAAYCREIGFDFRTAWRLVYQS